MSYHRMRRWVGYLGMSLPFSLWLGNWAFHQSKVYSNLYWMELCRDKPYNSMQYLRNSISEYYYTPMGELFVGTLCAVAFFLFLYRGYEKKEGETMPSDSFMTNFAGICALLVAIFPMSFDQCFDDNFRVFISSNTVGWIHNISAILFFIALGIISLVNFRRTDKVEYFGKMPSHNFYKYCGIGILVSISLVILLNIPAVQQINFIRRLPVIYIFETTALLFFGASWLKKGQVSSN
ncbi:MAG: hypothetical protein JST78_09395 [Bacteroidetes bacterium]|nr:hypothetical protein [Bacteroidota bacterium]